MLPLLRAFALALGTQEAPPKMLDRESGGAVLDGLRWLRAAQKADGSWEEKFREHTVGVTGLALLAFLAADFSTESKEKFGGDRPFGDVVAGGFNFILGRQDAEGSFVRRGDPKGMYDQIVATLALSEAYSRTRAEAHRKALRKAVDFLVAARNPGKGWRYSPACGDSDTSVTGWALLALRSGALSGFDVPRATMDQGRSWIESLTNEKGRAGYVVRGDAKIIIGRRVFDDHETLTALAILARLACGEDRSKLPGIPLLTRDPPDGEKKKVDYLYWLLSSAAIRAREGAESRAWADWRMALKAILLRIQSDTGNFPMPDEHSTYDVGEIYAAATGLLALELCCGYRGHFLLRGN